MMPAAAVQYLRDSVYFLQPDGPVTVPSEYRCNLVEVPEDYAGERANYGALRLELAFFAAVLHNFPTEQQKGARIALFETLGILLYTGFSEEIERRLSLAIDYDAEADGTGYDYNGEADEKPVTYFTEAEVKQLSAAVAAAVARVRDIVLCQLKLSRALGIADDFKPWISGAEDADIEALFLGEGLFPKRVLSWTGKIAPAVTFCREVMRNNYADFNQCFVLRDRPLLGLRPQDRAHSTTAKLSNTIERWRQFYTSIR